MGKLNYWTPQEDKILFDEFQNFKSRKWKNISKILRENGFIRGEAECRQRYVNHLDPTLDKNPQISNSELEILYQKYQVYGPKWCSIQMFLPNRTQIRIKNIFYGNIRLFLKKMYKYFAKKTAVFINELKTDDLQSIYDSTQEFQGFNLLKKAFRKLNYKVNQQSCKIVFSSSQAEYLQLLNRILQYKTKIKPLTKKYQIQRKAQTKQNSQISQLIQSCNKYINLNNLDDMELHQRLEGKQKKQKIDQIKAVNRQKPCSVPQQQMSFKAYSNYPFSQYWNHTPPVLSNFHIAYPCSYMTNDIQPYGFNPLNWGAESTTHSKPLFNQYYQFSMHNAFMNQTSPLHYEGIGGEEQKIQQTVNLSQ